MKKILPTLALAALAVCGTVAFASPAHAVSYYDSYGRAYYYNSWGQPVYYDTGYNGSTYYSPSPASQPVYTQTTYSAAQPMYGSQPDYSSQQTTTTYSQQDYSSYDDQPQMAAVPAETTQTTYQYYYPDGSASATTYVSQTDAQPVTSSACRQSSRTVKQWGETAVRYTTECRQSDGSWMEQ